MNALLRQAPDLDSRPRCFALAYGAFAGLQMVDPIIGGLCSPTPRAKPKDRLHRIQRWFDQVVEVPNLVALGSGRMPSGAVECR
ncbi:hypothetical protein DLE60_08220 [Micromonospora globispora]|nr:hypothetical protein DLE60_08220 [Micromonospora globispora]